jgi:cell pole-organizing protein PopZ
MSDAKPPSDLSMDEVLATIRRIIAEDEQSPGGGGPGGSKGPGAAAAADDVLELTEALNDDGTVRHLAPIGSVARPAERLREPPLPAAPEKPETEARPEPLLPRGEPSLSAPQHQKEPAGAGLLSETASLAAGSAFARLAATPPPAADEAPTVGGRPLDEIARDELRPMLRAWLDKNLPQMVERLVQAEITRIAARSGPE